MADERRGVSILQRRTFTSYISLIFPVNEKKHTANPGNPLANRGAVTAASKPHPQEPARRWTRPSASKIIIKGNNKKNKNGENKIK